MKKLLKSEDCGSREQCMGPTNVAEKSNITAKKKKKRKTQTLGAQTHNPNAASLWCTFSTITLLCPTAVSWREMDQCIMKKKEYHFT